MGQAHEHFIADAGHDGQHGQMEKEAQEEIVDRKQNVQHEEEQDADDKDDQEERRSAAGMQARKSLSVFGRQRKTGLLAVDGFVLRAVILEGAADIGNKAHQEHVAQQQHHFQQTAQERIAHGTHAGIFQDGFQTGGQGHKDAEGQGHGQDNGDAHHNFVDALAEFFGQPDFKLRGFLVEDPEHFGGIAEGVHSVIEHGTHIDHAADEGLTHPGIFFL